MTKKAEHLFNGVVLTEIPLWDSDILWCWEKAMPADRQGDRVVRVTATRLGDVCVCLDRPFHHIRTGNIYLDADCLDAINHARSLIPCSDPATDD